MKEGAANMKAGAAVQLVLASGNRHKCDELRGALGKRFQLLPQTALGIEGPPETGETFVENALLKARHAARAAGRPALADDSGLVVAGLGGQPGIHSARYAGQGATDAQNNAKLLAAMQGLEERLAHFHCCLVYLRDGQDPAPLIAEGIWTGHILTSARGTGGFGYDPLFQPQGLDCSAAELPPAEKRRLSHRGQALRRLAQLLAEA